MATVTRRTKGKPIPQGAEIRTVSCRRLAHWTDGSGNSRKATLTKDGTKIHVPSETYCIRFNAETDRRHLRRSMSIEELQWLLHVTATRPAAAHHASGEDRAMCYLLAAATGYRAGELKSLTTNGFDLDGPSPEIALAAARSKRRKLERQPVPAGIVPKLRAWLEKSLPAAASSLRSPVIRRG